MRKIFAIFISLIICLLPLGITSVAVNDETKNVSLDDFTSDFVALVNSEALTDEISGMSSAEYGSSFSSSPECEEESTRHTNRLVVKSSLLLDPLDSIGYVYGYDDLHILQFSNQESMLQAMELYSSLDYVEYVEEDAYLTEAVSEEGVVVEDSLDYPTIVQSNIFGYSTAKVSSDGYSVDIAVIDSGVQHDHDLLKGRVVDSGFNCVDDNGTAYDDRGHGTHVAGIIVANTLDNVTVHAYKALDNTGAGSAVQVVLAIEAAIEDDVDIINLSMQMKGSSYTLQEGIIKARDAGICVIVAAGNAGEDLEHSYYVPGGFEEVISVMSCSNSRKILESSNYNPPYGLVAPGENILSSYIGNAYKVSTGTSMAAPFICAAAAYELAKDPELTHDEIYEALVAKSQWCYGSPRGRCVYPATSIPVMKFTATPEFEIDSGTFVDSMEVKISCETSGSKIFYSLNDSATCLEYTGPFTISETTTISAFAISDTMYSSETSRVTYALFEGDGNLFVVNENDELVGYNGTETDVYVPSYINGNGVKTVTSGAFSGNTTVKNIYFESSLRSVGENAFLGCSSLLSVSAPNVADIGDSAFKGCESLTKLVGKNIINIGTEAFYGCLNFNNISTDNLQTVGDRAFALTSALTSFSAPSLKVIGDESFLDSAITELGVISVEEIGDYAFSGCTGLTSLILTEVTAIGEGAFNNCSSLGIVSFNKLTAISDYCFNGCTSLATISASLVEEIGSYAFSGCSSLKKYQFNVVTTIKAYAFDSVPITSIDSSHLNNIEKFAFNNCTKLTTISLSAPRSFDLNVLTGAINISIIKLSNVTELVFPEEGLYSICPNVVAFYADNVKVLPDNAFNGCSKLTTPSFTLLTQVGDYAFKGTALTEVKFSSLEAAGVGAFSEMKKLTTIGLPALAELNTELFAGDSSVSTVSLGITELPADLRVASLFRNVKSFSASKVTAIPDYAFSGCTELKSISFGALKTIGKEAFKDCNLSSISTSAYSIGENAFDGNDALVEVTFNQLKNIDCDILGSSVKSVQGFYANKVTSIYDTFFSSFTRLQYVQLDSLKTVPDNFFKNKTVLKNASISSATYIGNSAFYGCKSLKEVCFDYVQSIGDKTFYNCTSLTTIIADGIQSFSYDLFEGCTSVEYISMGKLKSIPMNGTKSPFVNLKNLKEFYNYAMVNVPDYAFYGCTSLNTVTFLGATSIGNYAFKDTGLTSITANKVVSIGDYAFSGTDFTSFEHDKVGELGKGSFSSCDLLKSVDLKNATIIGDECFGNCVKLKTVNFGNVTSIGDAAFSECNDLTYIHNGDTPVDVGADAFSFCINLNVFENIRLKSIGSYALYGTIYNPTFTYELPDIVKIEEDAFEGMYLRALVLENVEEIYDVPENCRVYIGTDVVNGSVDTSTSSTIYSPADSLVSQYCIKNGVNYVEFNESNSIIDNTKAEMLGYNDTLKFTAEGFNIEYYWYGCNNTDCSDAILITSGNNIFRPFIKDDVRKYKEQDYKYFYCIAKSTENGNVVNIKSDLVRNTFTYLMDVNNKTEVDYYNNFVFTGELNQEEFKNNIHLEEGHYDVTPSHFYGDTASWGTGTVIDILDDEEDILDSYTLILDGDVNGDGYVNVIDVSIACDALNQHKEIKDENFYMAAAWFDDSDGISVHDYQAIVNKSLS